MFTIEQVKAAHVKVISGADFPAYIQELIQLGVAAYETFVADGHADYYGQGQYKVSAPGKYDPLIIAGSSNMAQFKTNLKDHQQGKTTYMTFCTDCAKSGVEKWTVNMKQMTCTYSDKAGNEMLSEAIPVVH